MSVHIALPHLHLPHLSRREILRAAAVCVPAVLLLAADAAGFTVPALTLLVGAVVAWRVTDRYWQRRYARFAAGVDANTRALQVQLARLEREAVERFNAEVLDRNSRWPALNEAARVGVR